jgi:hypothetical protein
MLIEEKSSRLEKGKGNNTTTKKQSKQGDANMTSYFSVPVNVPYGV